MPRALLLALLLATACRRAADASPPSAPTTAHDPTTPTPTIDPTAPGLAPAEQRARARALAALDIGRFDLARAELARILAVAPDNLATRVLYTAATHALLDARTRAATRFADVVATIVPPPPWQHTVTREVEIPNITPPPKLVQTSATPAIDEAEWFLKNNLRLPEYEVPNPMRGLPGDLPPNLPPTYGDFLLVQAIHHADHTILVYGADYSSGRFVAVLDERGQPITVLDFDAYRLAPASKSTQSVLWAEVRDDVLYISHGHAGQAVQAGHPGQAAYLTAVDASTGALRWRSDPGVAGAANFVIHGGHILTGHDHLLVLDRRRGTIAARVPLASALDYLFVRRGTLLVRTHDSDLEFALR